MFVKNKFVKKSRAVAIFTLNLFALGLFFSPIAVQPVLASEAEHSLHSSIQLGPRPAFLVNDMTDSALKTKLQGCLSQPAKRSDFSIGHRGAPMQFPEHTQESYEAAIQMGAGILECDVTFTQDKALVCRHSQCDLHTTTNILATDLANKCSQNFQPATFNADGSLKTEATAKCCTSDITVAEFKTLQGKMDAANTAATTVDDYLNGTANWRTDLYASRGTLMTHAESIALFKKHGVKMTPELKSASVDMPYGGDYSQADYAQQLIDEYIAARVPASDVFAQSFNIEDVKYWIKNAPEFGKQAVYLDDVVYEVENGIQKQIDSMPAFVESGIQYIAPPIRTLVSLDDNNQIVPSAYAKAAKANGLKLISWTLERSGTLTDGGGWYYEPVNSVISKSGDTYELVDILARDVGIVGLFSDWPATTTFYANCMGL
ncbi:glycerophosphodiester phosphodiesterase family protein [Ostreibacterium oceani]|uniref:glycerophosphodiester phosphodiesterase n=1 Tax=Ostreibacterium oceani TaxID=2654998 RepID=A0A6N7EW04_9GAMM|nr:glycerophosphodiester phosphodiesterase family protein [Ostreibacterium oceani]MPV86944.1 glycerophosphodiester phosphodiesterase [Ostreibacterium oceani]